MGVSLAEAVTRLMAGAKLSWQTFEQHKAGAIALTHLVSGAFSSFSSSSHRLNR